MARTLRQLVGTVVGATALALPGPAAAIVFSTGLPDGRLGMASRQGTTGAPEIEAADDFVLAAPDTIGRMSFTGVIPAGSAPVEVGVEIYRVFPLDSTNPPDGRVPTRTNSPSDVEFAGADSATAGTLSYTTTVLDHAYAVSNSIVNGINPIPNQTTGGEGPVTGVLTRFDVVLSTPISLPPNHYFFVPQVRLSSGNFLWASAAKPISGPGTPFTPDLQTWMRNAALDPDWLRVGTDIVGGATPPTFNGAFSLGCPALVASPASLPPAFAGTPYGLQLTGSGGTGPYGFTTADPLPPGFSLTSTGLLVGTPTQPGSYSLTITVFDSLGCQGSSAVTLNIEPTPRAAPTTLPRMAGRLAVGRRVSCQSGAWTDSPSFAYRWLRDGSPISGATLSTYTPVLGDAGRALQCEVIATDSGGPSIAASAAAVVPVPPAPTAAIQGGSVKVAHRAAPLGVKCAGVTGQRCTGTLTLSSGRVKLGSSRVSIAATRRATIEVQLSHAGLELLRAAPHHRLGATATLGQTRRRLTLSE